MIHAAAGLNQAPLGQHARQIPAQEPEGPKRAVLPEQTTHHHHQVARGDGQPIAAVKIRGNVLDAHQEAVLHGMHVDFRRQRPPVAGQHLAHMIAARVWRVNTLPPQQLGAPCDIRVFAINEKIGVEEFAIE